MHSRFSKSSSMLQFWVNWHQFFLKRKPLPLHALHVSKNRHLTLDQCLVKPESYCSVTTELSSSFACRVEMLNHTTWALREWKMLIQAINSKPHSFLLLMVLMFGMYHTIKGKLFLRAVLFPDILTLMI